MGGPDEEATTVARKPHGRTSISHKKPARRKSPGRGKRARLILEKGEGSHVDRSGCCAKALIVLSVSRPQETDSPPGDHGDHESLAVPVHEARLAGRVDAWAVSVRSGFGILNYALRREQRGAFLSIGREISRRRPAQFIFSGSPLRRRWRSGLFRLHGRTNRQPCRLESQRLHPGGGGASANLIDGIAAAGGVKADSSYLARRPLHNRGVLNGGRHFAISWRRR